MSAPDETPPAGTLRLHSWRDPAVLAVTALSAFSGFGQFAATAALPDVAAAFGEPTQGRGVGIAAEVGLSGTTLGLGLAVIRGASLAALPLARLADRYQRRTVLLWCCALGLAMTATAALSPTFWWFVAIFAVGRPLLSATNIVAGVVAAEETRANSRAAAAALVTAGYGFGAGTPVVLRAFGDGALGFRWLFAGALVLLALVPLVGRVLEEPVRHQLVAVAAGWRARLGHVPRRLRPRLRLVAALTFALGFVTGPVTTYVLVYAENVQGLSPAVFGLVIPAAGAVGLGGLFTGRALADRVGRRVTCAAAMAGIAAGGLATYTLGPAGAVVGYMASIFLASIFAPAAGALHAEVFPTSVRATTAGWLGVAGTFGAVAGLLLFGILADALGGFGPAAAIVTLPVAFAALGYLRLPETRGLELEESAPELAPEPA